MSRTDIIFGLIGLISYFLVTLRFTIIHYRDNNEEKFKETLPWLFLTFTIAPPIIIAYLVAVFGFVAGLGYFLTEWLPKKIFKFLKK